MKNFLYESADCKMFRITFFVVFLVVFSNTLLGINNRFEKIPYDSTAKRKLYLHVFYPDDYRIKRNNTAIIHFFGGGWVSGNATQFYPQCRYLASKGYIAISADYRTKKEDGVTPFDCVEDARKVIRFVRANSVRLGVDPNKLVASGGSAGGHIALCTAVFKRNSKDLVSAIPNALILYNPVLDTTKEGYGFNMFEGNELLLSPNHNICKGIPPTLIFHGKKDKTVPYENALMFESLMGVFGNTCKLVSFESADHGFFNPTKKNGVDAFNRCMEEAILFLHRIKFSPLEKLASERYHVLRSSFTNFLLKQNKEVVRVAFIGGSITQGGGWRDSICTYLKNKFPHNKIEFVNAGISAQGAISAAFRIDRDVLSKGMIDLAFIDVSVNDRMPALRCSSLDRIRSMEGVIRHLRKVNKNIDIVLLHFVDQFKMADYRIGNIPQEIKVYESVAEHYNVPSINLAKEVNDRIMNREFSWETDFKGIHPSSFGHSIYSNSIKCFLENSLRDADISNSSVVDYVLPDKLDSLCYDSGKLISCKNANPIKGFEFKPLKKGGNLFFQSDCIGDSFKLEFIGRAIGMVVLSGPDAGMIEYSIDGKSFERFDLYTVNSWVDYIPRYYTLCDTLEANKLHSLVVRISKQCNSYSTGNRCIISDFYINK